MRLRVKSFSNNNISDDSGAPTHGRNVSEFDVLYFHMSVNELLET